MEQFPERNPAHYIWNFFYYNKKDARVFVPKSNPDRGITVNFAKRGTYLFLLGIFAFFGFIILMILSNGQ